MLYSKTANSFFIKSIHGENIPPDCIEIDNSTHSDLLEKQSRGATITHDDSGNPVAIFMDSHPSKYISCTPAQGLVALFTIKGMKESDILDAISGIENVDQRYLARIGYMHAKTWDRHSPTMKTIAGLLMLTEDDMDALFAEAVTVQV